MLTADMLNRIKSITDVFYEIDGISYEKALSIYESGANPESEITIYEEMARVYKIFLASRSLKQEEKIEAYKTLLLRSFYNEAESISKLNNGELSYEEGVQLIKQYKLDSKPAVLYADD